MDEVAAVGHRVVHAGERYSGSVIITDDVVDALKACIPLAPLHNPANITGIVRGISGGVINKLFIQCTTGCPTSIADRPTYDNQSVPAAAYIDLSATWRFGPERQYQLFFNVRNLTNSYLVGVGRYNTTYTGIYRVYLNEPRSYRLTATVDF